MAQAITKMERKYRSYGSLEPPLALVSQSNRPLVRVASLALKAQRALWVGMVGLAVLAGVDKFLFVLADWSAYVAPAIPAYTGLSLGWIVALAGVGEIILGLGMAWKAKVYADAFAAWICLITVNLIIQGEHFDVALFNFALAAGACALARLSKAREIESSMHAAPPVNGRRAA